MSLICPMEIKDGLTKRNYTPGRTKEIQYIVIHYTASTGDAPAQCKYFANNTVGASAHVFVGFNGDVWMSVHYEDTAWHCGAKSYVHAECRNSNSIGIEMCGKKDSTGEWYFTPETVSATCTLVAYLACKYGIDIKTHVIRHHDVTGKICPRPYVIKPDDWTKFITSACDTYAAMYKIKAGTYKTLKNAYVRVGNDVRHMDYAHTIQQSLIDNGKCKYETTDSVRNVIFLKAKSFSLVDSDTDLNGNMWGKTKSGFWLPVRYNDNMRVEVIK